MSLAANILWLGNQRLITLLAELELSLAQPQWFKVYRQASRIRVELEGQLRGVEVVVFPRMAQTAPEMNGEAERLRTSHGQLGKLASELTDAVHVRKADQTRCIIHRLRACLREHASAIPSAVVRIEDSVGDISRELVWVLQDTNNPDAAMACSRLPTRRRG